MYKNIYILFFFLFSWFNAMSQLVINNNSPYNDPIFLIDSVLLGEGVLASSHSFQGDPMQIGFFDAINSSINFEKGVVLGIGDVNLLDPNFNGIVFDPPNNVTDPDLLNVANEVPPLIDKHLLPSIHDVAKIEFDFIPYSDSLKFGICICIL